MRRQRSPHTYLQAMRQLCLVLLMTCHALGFSQDGMLNGDELHRATLAIYDRIQAVQPCTNRGDTLFFEDVKCGAGHPCGALLLDSLYPLHRNPNTVLGVFRVFKVSNHPYVSSDTSGWEAVTYLGEGRGYQVQFGLAYFSATPAGLTLNRLDLDVGYLGEYFNLPKWTIHEFNDDMEPWGAMVFVNHSWRTGFGHSTLSVLDLGGANHHQFTLHHVVDARRVEGYWEKGNEPEEWKIVKAVWDKRFSEDTNPERYYECNLDWHFQGRSLVVDEHKSYTYFEKIDLMYPVDSTVVLPMKQTIYRQDVWPARYTTFGQ